PDFVPERCLGVVQGIVRGFLAVAPAIENNKCGGSALCCHGHHLSTDQGLDLPKGGSLTNLRVSVCERRAGIRTSHPSQWWVAGCQSPRILPWTVLLG